MHTIFSLCIRSFTTLVVSNLFFLISLKFVGTALHFFRLVLWNLYLTHEIDEKLLHLNWFRYFGVYPEIRVFSQEMSKFSKKSKENSRHQRNFISLVNCNSIFQSIKNLLLKLNLLEFFAWFIWSLFEWAKSFWLKF